MSSRYSRSRKGPFTCATHEDGTQLCYVRIYYQGREQTLGRYPTEQAAHLAYYEFGLQLALQQFPPLTTEQHEHLQQATRAYSSVKEFLALFERTWRPLQFAPDFRQPRARQSKTPLAASALAKKIPGISHILLKNGESRWLITRKNKDHVESKRFTSEHDAQQYCCELQVQRALQQFPVPTTNQLRVLRTLRRKDPLLHPVVDLLINSTLNWPTTEPYAQPPKHAPLFQSGLPTRHRQRPTGPPPDANISFADYAHRWFEANQKRWLASSQEGTRCICTKHLIPAFGPIRLRELSSARIAEWLTSQLKSYSLVRCRSMRTQLTSILYAAIADGLLATNPATGPGCMLPIHATQYQRTTPTLKGE